MTGSERSSNHTDNELVIYRCTECGKTSVSIGWIHAHAEKHLGWGPFNLLPPPFPGNFGALMEITEVLRVDDYSSVALDEVEVRG